MYKKRYDSNKCEKHYSYCEKYDGYKKSKDYSQEYDYELVGCYLKKPYKYYGYKKYDGCKY